ncbi:hypothetical protein ACIP79_26225 [Streptomyces sp. NPDC088747]|uniref:hypothetical protein n=1 Tax=Streptomyces sp. NPDC088747 TaxID=3365886 RepID=UPI0037FAD188
MSCGMPAFRRSSSCSRSAAPAVWASTKPNWSSTSDTYGTGTGIARTADSPLDLESLGARAAGVPGRVVAIEAVWDGDTVHDWFVLPLAVTADPAGGHPLATIYRDSAVRHLGDEDPGPLHPSAFAADRAGRALAARLSVPFRFAGPDTPGDEAPGRLRAHG